MKKAFEFALAIVVSVAAWIWLFPALGATSSTMPTLNLVIAILAYATITSALGQLVYGAEIIIGARYHQNLVFAALLASQTVTPYIAIAVASIFTPGLVTSYAWLAPSVVLGFIAYFALLALTGRVRDAIDRYEILTAVTLIVNKDGAFVPKIRKGELVPGERLVVEPVLINAADEDIRRALHKGIAGDWETADMLMLRAIPELEGCHFTGVLRLQAACTVMKQSMLAVDATEEAQEYQRFYDTLAIAYRQRGAF